MADMPASQARTNSHGISTSTMPIVNWLAPSVGITCGSGSPSSSAPFVSWARFWTSLPLPLAGSWAIWPSSLASPALAITPAQQAGELRRELHHIGQDARGGPAHSQAELDGTVRELRGMIGSARARHDQQQWLWTAGVCGMMGGALLWFMLTAVLPWGGGTWLASLAFGGRWNADEAMMQDASPAQWERMARLYKACPQDSTTGLCEAAITVRTITPGQEGARAPAFGTAPAQPRGNAGLRH